MSMAFCQKRNQWIACFLLFIGTAAVVFGGRSAVATGCAQATLRSAGVFNVGDGPRSIATGDFNSDGRPDFVTGNYEGDSVSIYVSNALNDLVSIGNFPVGSHPRSVATGDFNGDLKTDLVTANDTDMQVAVLLNDGAGGFSNPSKVNLGSEGRYAVVSDFNGDTRPDVAVNTSAGVKILLGNGAGGFVVTTSTGFGDLMVVGDFDNDGDPDLALASHSQTPILRNNGAGAFTLVSGCVNTGLDSVAAGDFNGDGKLDLVGTRILEDRLWIMIGIGNGCFNAATIYDLPALADAPYAVAAADFNHDGKLDVATANSGSSNLSMFLGDGAGILCLPECMAEPSSRAP